MHEQLKNTLTSYKKIFFVGGGTGGHVQPILNIIEDIRLGDLDMEYTWIGGENSQEEHSAKSQNIPFITIPTLKLSTTRSPKILLYPLVLIQGILKARNIFKNILKNDETQQNGVRGEGTVGTEMKNCVSMSEASTEGVGLSPETFGTFSHKSTAKEKSKVAVFSKGGPGSVAVGIAAWTLGIPLYIHESDTIPGRSNRVLAIFATTIFLGFESAKQYFNAEKCETIGQILHPVFDGQVTSDKGQVSWKTKKKHILVICGSQGARSIFEEVLKNLETLLQKHEIILILGKLNTDMRESFENQISQMSSGTGIDIQILDWINQSDLAHIIPKTDIAVTRGSATTLAELTAFESKPHLIIVPLPFSAGNHQYYNALEYKKLGHTVVEQRDIDTLLKIITQHATKKYTTHSSYTEKI